MATFPLLAAAELLPVLALVTTVLVIVAWLVCWTDVLVELDVVVVLFESAPLLVICELVELLLIGAFDEFELMF